MGLDMYLNKRTYVGAEYRHRNIKGSIEITKDDKPVQIKFDRISYITERVGYWRKANQIHNWFVKNVQGGKDDCGHYEVSKEQLQKLFEDCKKVKENQTVAADVLPTKPGFFFGSTEYDDYYMDDIDATIEMIGPLIEEISDYDISIEYTSSW